MIDGTLYNRFVTLIKSAPSEEQMRAFTAALSFSELDFITKVIDKLRPDLSDLLIEKITEENDSHQANMNLLLTTVQQATSYINKEKRRHSRKDDGDKNVKKKSRAKKAARRKILETFCKKYPNSSDSAIWTHWDDQEVKEVKVGRTTFLNDLKTFRKDTINKVSKK